MNRLAVIALAGMLVAGCGQTGALFLPGETPETAPEDTATTEDDDEETAAG